MLTQTTIGDHFDLAHATLEQIVEEISDGEFDPTFLSRYPRGTELRECCVMAVERLAAVPFTGRKTCADVMGRAMELLRYFHKLDTPRGWVPAIRLLRSGPGSPRRVAAPVAEEAHYAYQVPVPPAEEVLTDTFSALCCVDRECDGVLLTYAKQHPEFMDVLVKLAQKHGVPQGWANALLFVGVMIAELGEVVPEPVLVVKKRLEFRLLELGRHP
jgi:hypothetical protein